MQAFSGRQSTQKNNPKLLRLTKKHLKTNGRNYQKCKQQVWITIAERCDAMVYFPDETEYEDPNAEPISEFISKRIGCVRDDQNKLVRLISPEEICSIQPGRAICMMAGYDPIDDIPYDYNTHPAVCQRNENTLPRKKRTADHS